MSQAKQVVSDRPGKVVNHNLMDGTKENTWDNQIESENVLIFSLACFSQN